MAEKMKKTLSVVMWIVVGIVIGAGSLFVWNSYVVKNPSAVSKQMDQAQIKELIAKVGKLMILPVGEDPAIATITDAASLMKDQAFYRNAKNGDMVFVYQKASQAIIYSPDRNIIVNVGPVILQDQQAATSTPKSTSTSTTKSKK